MSKACKRCSSNSYVKTGMRWINKGINAKNVAMALLAKVVRLTGVRNS